MWIIAKYVVVPNLKDDIAILLFAEILRLYNQCVNKDKRSRIRSGTEMLPSEDVKS